MVAIVIAINLLITLICLVVAWQLWKLRRTLAKVTATLVAAERSTHKLLHNAPDAIVKGQLGIYQLRQAYQGSGPQLQRVRKALALLGLGQSFFWQFSTSPVPRSSGIRPMAFVRRGVRSFSRPKRRRF
jgi:hypothetical protein